MTPPARPFDSDTHNWVSDYKLRERVLYRVGQLMRANAERLSKVVSLEVGMPVRQAVGHIGAAADVFEFYAGYCSKLYGEAMVLANGSVINLLKEPVGVVGVITPWNFPLTQTARKVAPAKPASYTPASTYELIRLLHEAGLPSGVVNCVPGPAELSATSSSRVPRWIRSPSRARPRPARTSSSELRWT